jgi:hypothetical protein
MSLFSKNNKNAAPPSVAASNTISVDQHVELGWTLAQVRQRYSRNTTMDEPVLRLSENPTLDDDTRAFWAFTDKHHARKILICGVKRWNIECDLRIVFNELDVVVETAWVPGSALYTLDLHQLSLMELHYNDLYGKPEKELKDGSFVLTWEGNDNRVTAQGAVIESESAVYEFGLLCFYSGYEPKALAE